MFCCVRFFASKTKTSTTALQLFMNILYEVAYQLSSFHEPSNLMQLRCLTRTFSAFCRWSTILCVRNDADWRKGRGCLQPNQGSWLSKRSPEGSPWPRRRALHHQITPYQEGLFHKNQQEPRPSNGTAFCLSYGWDYTHTDCSIWRRGFGRKMPSGRQRGIQQLQVINCTAIVSATRHNISHRYRQRRLGWLHSPQGFTSSKLIWVNHTSTLCHLASDLDQDHTHRATIHNQATRQGWSGNLLELNR